jgi:hypothetical protein
VSGRSETDSLRAVWSSRWRTYAGATATITVLCLGFDLGVAGCFRETSAEHTYAEGLAMVNDSVAAFAAGLDPQPALPSPRDEGDAGSCKGLDGDADGQMKIVKVYALGAVPIRTSDAWFEQARRFFADSGYKITVSVGQPGRGNLLPPSRRRPRAHRRVTRAQTLESGRNDRTHRPVPVCGRTAYTRADILIAANE